MYSRSWERAYAPALGDREIPASPETPDYPDDAWQDGQDAYERDLYRYDDEDRSGR